MIQSRFASALALAAFLAAPAFAAETTPTPLEKAAAKQSAAAPAQQAKADGTASGSVTQTDLSSGTMSKDGAYVAPLGKNSAQQSAAAPSTQTRADGTAMAGASADVSSGTKTVDGAHVAPLTKNSAKQQAAADCVDHSGKLADNSATGTKDAVDCTTKTAKKTKKKATTTASNK